MYCKHCGKELSDEALMCPNCGTPTQTTKVANRVKTIETDNAPASPLATAAFALSMITFVFGIFFAIYCATIGIISFSLTIYNSSFSNNGYIDSYYFYPKLLFGFAVALITVFTSLGGLVAGIISNCRAKEINNKKSRGFAVTAIIVTSFILLVILLMFAIFGVFAG